MTIYDLRKAQRFDDLTRRYARHPHEHATPADYARSHEAPDALDRSIARGDLLYRIAVIASIVSVFGTVGIVVLETVFK